jgi:hypothetical protein
MGRRVLDQEHHRGRVLAADGQPLHQAEHHDQRRGEDADLAVVRQQADEERRHGHGDDRERERGLAADAITDGPKTSPPTGRIMKPAANTPKAAISEATGSFDGKKWAPIVCAK